jgi:hypothetical protein
MDPQFYEYLEEKFRDIKSDLKSDIVGVRNQITNMSDTLNDHIKEDQKVWNEVFFVKRFILTSWALILAWLGYKQSH